MRTRSEDEITFAGMKFRPADRIKDITNKKYPKWGKFKIKALWPQDQRDVANRIAGFAVFGTQNYQRADLARFERDATILVGVVKGPAWWDGPDKCPLESCLNWLNEEILVWTEELQKKIGGDEQSDSESAEESDD